MQNIPLPCRSGETSQNQPLLVGAHLGHIRRFHTLPDPVALLQRVDEHELNTDVVAVSLLESVQDFPVVVRGYFKKQGPIINRVIKVKLRSRPSKKDNCCEFKSEEMV